MNNPNTPSKTICRTATLLALGATLGALPACNPAPAPAAKTVAQAPAPITNVAERVATKAKPSVVRIYSGCQATMRLDDNVIPNLSYIMSGTGFFIHADGYVMTNAHVVSTTKDGDNACLTNILVNFAKDQASNSQYTAQQWFDMLKDKAVFGDVHRVAHVVVQSGKFFPFEIKEYGAPAGEGRDLRMGKDVAVLKIEVKNAPTLKFADSSKMKVGDKVWILGYPGKAYSPKVLDQKSALQPMTTGGAITSTMATSDGAPLLGTDAAASQGNSGGPAVDKHGNVVGLLTLGAFQSDSFNYLVASDTAAEFIPHAASKKKSGRVDRLWDKGLTHYWAGEYGLAKRNFKRILDLSPDHSEATRLLAEINEEHGDELAEQEATKKDKRRKSAQAESSPQLAGLQIAGFVLAGLFGLFTLGGLLAGFVHQARRRRNRVPSRPNMPRPAAQPTPAATPRQAQAPAHAPAAATRTMVYEGPSDGASARLTCTSGPLVGREFAIGQGVIIGRDPARAQIVIDDAGVSGAHVWVGPMGGHIVAIDYQSTNGTFVNERYTERVQKTALGSGDVVSVGRQGTAKFALVA